MDDPDLIIEALCSIAIFCLAVWALVELVMWVL